MLQIVLSFLRKTIPSDNVPNFIRLTLHHFGVKCKPKQVFPDLNCKKCLLLFLVFRCYVCHKMKK